MTQLLQRFKRINLSRIRKKIVHIKEQIAAALASPEELKTAQPSLGMQVYLGCGPLPFSKQDKEFLGQLENWVLVDKYIDDPRIQPWDAEVLSEIDDGLVKTFYTSHMLEHISHMRIPEVLTMWHRKLQPGGELVINVPDLLWISEEIVRYAAGEKLVGQHFTEFDGPYGMVAMVYGSQHHEGEYHKSGFIDLSLRRLLEAAGFVDITIERTTDSHDMGVLISRAVK